MASTQYIADHLIDKGFEHLQAGRTTCPICGPNRMKSDEPTFSVRIEDNWALYMCHHCEETGRVNLSSTTNEYEKDFHGTEYSQDWPPELAEEFTPAELVEIGESATHDELSDLQLTYLYKRGISQDTAERCGVHSGMAWIRRREEEVPCIGFPYVNHDGSTAVKWRDGMKNFTQTGAAASLWRIEKFTGGDLIITEGEMDALSFEEIGVFATSVPNGAPAKLVADVKSKKFSYLWEGKTQMDRATRIIIACDADTPGQLLTEEIARRVGRHRCYRMEYPDKCKDANDVLVKHGPEALKLALEGATPWPIPGLKDVSECITEVLAICEGGREKGIEVRVGKIGQLYRPTTGTLTICTGIPGSGKSTFLTWLSYYLAEHHHWNSAVFAAETSMNDHMIQLAALKLGREVEGVNRAPKEEVRRALEWAEGRFIFIDERDTEISSILERAAAAVLRSGVRILMIDPFNFISVDETKDGDNGQNGFRKLLVGLKGFALEHDVAVWLVAHPTKLQRDGRGNVPVPTGYDISGSAHFFNVADQGITLSRDQEKPNVSQLTVWKVRNKRLGTNGACEIQFNHKDGSFSTLKEWGQNATDFDLDNLTL